MRLIHYYLIVAALLVPMLVAAPVTGLWYDGSELHLSLGLLMAFLCVAANTVVILFSIVSGRVVKAAMIARPIGADVLEEANAFFAKRAGYPVALSAASLAVATAVLGYGRNIGVPIGVHLTLGLTTVVLNGIALRTGWKAILANQRILDRTRRELDRLDAELGPTSPETAAIDWRWGPATRRLIFAACAWLPYAYWGLIVWRGDFSRLPTGFLVATIVVSVAAAASALRRRREPAS